ncbi:hypothetical protein EGK_14694 [Macaca mulatta]|uniref:Uncharacterized protein n=2 Tax=Macaca TaxID=9539 RepID=F7BXA5_MACMU|nr:hypothetical protein EGK_14694 [Macaca mulatta]EHH52900.1 hypothetical protein EGM_13434 [Macaca fascicularis]
MTAEEERHRRISWFPLPTQSCLHKSCQWLRKKLPGSSNLSPFLLPQESTYPPLRASAPPLLYHLVPPILLLVSAP